jgi:predicted transcriptional regulator
MNTNHSQQDTNIPFNEGTMRLIDLQDPFVRVLRHLENTLTASHIAAFPVLCCPPADDVTKVRKVIAKDRLDFSHVPIRDDKGHVRWIARREDLTEKRGPLVDHAMPLNERNVVDASLPLRDTLQLLQNQGVLLVRSPESGQPDGISGIINHADVQKTPVRLLLFTQITEIEARLRNRLSREHWEEDPRCTGFVKDAAYIQSRYPERRLPLINYLNPGRLMLLTRACGIRLLSELSDEEFTNRSKELSDLRNNIAHTNDLGCSGGTNPLDTIEAVNRAFGLVDATLGAVVRLGQTD